MKLTVLNRIGLTINVIKTALAAGLSWQVASFVSHSQYPYFAALGAVLTVQVTVADSINKAMQRVIGIIGGVIVSIIIGHWLPLNPGSITLAVLIGMAVSTALRLNPQIISQVAVSSLLVLAFGSTRGYAIDRIIETVIGCAIAILLNIALIPPNPIPDAEKRVLHLSEYACTVLNNLAIAFEMQALRPTDMPYIQELVDETEKSYQAVHLAAQSLRYSPFLRNKRSRVLALSRIIGRFERITIQIRGIARALVDLGPDVQPDDRLIQAMKATATCIGLVAPREIYDSDELKERLQSSIEQAKELQNTCILGVKKIESLHELTNFGSILTDLGRILVEVQGDGPVITERE
ncbi:MAG: FUSC family protein [Alicyclobacillus herbarius]|uniref:FUSC family protein n=1 Tax=Alicyclobacillus herbarius TaxID=122960 RepID=UPI0004237B42|nr:aromatic acid exporter family protein [Alicyclobacillus herbarius]MCL6634029.1 FUSC family protein [Alicyclobacillus herbarius]